MRQLALCLLILVVAACISATRTERLRVGMTKAEALAVMGRPVSFGADKQSEVMYYRLTEGDLGAHIHTYFVRLADGKVESFGRLVEPETDTKYVTSMPAPPPLPPPPQ